MFEFYGFNEIGWRLIGKCFDFFVQQGRTYIHGRRKLFFAEFGIRDVCLNHFHHFLYKFVVELVSENVFVGVFANKL
jgi:hypothetical protein